MTMERLHEERWRMKKEIGGQIKQIRQRRIVFFPFHLVLVLRVKCVCARVCADMSAV